MEESTDGPSTQFAAILLCILIGALFAAVEAALDAFGEPRLRAARDGKGKDASTATRLLAFEEGVRTRLLVGRVLSLLLSVLVSYEVALRYGDWWLKMTIPAVVALVYAVVAGVVMTLVARRASRLTLGLVRFWRPFELLVAVPAAPLIWARRRVDRLYPPDPADDPDRVTRVEVEHLIEQGREQGSIDTGNAGLLKSVIEFGDTVAREVMVPRTSMVAVSIDTPLADVMQLIVEQGHSRYPVYRGRIDQLEGVLYAKDLFRWWRERGESEGKLETLIRRPVFFAAESQKISKLLRDMQARRVHLAIVVDEYGGTSGMVTLEDVIEEIVGEIRDEHDYEEPPVRRIGVGRFLVNGDLSVYDMASVVGLELPSDVDAAAYDSVGGMLADLAGRVLPVGESLALGAHELIVRAGDERRVRKVEVVPRSQAPEDAQHKTSAV